MFSYAGAGATNTRRLMTDQKDDHVKRMRKLLSRMIVNFKPPRRARAGDFRFWKL